MSEAIAPHSTEGVTGDVDASLELAKVLQEQEQAWLYLLQSSQNPRNASASIGDESLGTRETGFSVQTQLCVLHLQPSNISKSAHDRMCQPCYDPSLVGLLVSCPIVISYLSDRCCFAVFVQP
jgi:hypothetical protein